MRNKLYVSGLLCFIFSFTGFSQNWGIYDLKGNLEKTIAFDEIKIFSETVMTGKNKDGLFLLSSEYQPMLNLQGEEIIEYRTPWILVRGTNGIGAFHEYGQLSLPLEFEEIKTYTHILLARKGNDYWMFERGKGKITFLGSSDEAILTHHGVIIVKKGDRYFLPLSKTPEKGYELLAENEGNFLLAKEESGFGLVNRDGDYILKTVLDKLEHTEGDYFYGFDENQYILVKGDDVRAQVSYNSYHKITRENGLILEYIHGKLRRVMKEDGILLDAIGMESVTLIGKDLYNVRFRENKLGLLGEKGWLVQPNSDAEWIGMGSEGLFPARKNGIFGFVNSSGQWIIRPQFAEVGLFHEGLAPYRMVSAWGVINSSGKIISESKWDEIQSFTAGMAIAKYQNSYFLIKSDGESATSTGFDKIKRLENGVFLVEFGALKGILDSKGSSLLPLEFEEITQATKDLFVVKKKGKAGMVTREGTELFKINFEDIKMNWNGQMVLVKEIQVASSQSQEAGKKRKKNTKGAL